MFFLMKKTTNNQSNTYFGTVETNTSCLEFYVKEYTIVTLLFTALNSSLFFSTIRRMKPDKSRLVSIKFKQVDSHLSNYVSEFRKKINKCKRRHKAYF
jgi:hypothetical protein